MSGLVTRSLPVELTHDPRFSARVKRLSAVSAVALGVVWALAVATLEVPMPVALALAVGWWLMPVTLLVSLLRPVARYALLLPATLVIGSLLAIDVGWLPGDPLARAGWHLALAGLLLGGTMGAWFWYRLVPVPTTLDDPFSPGRWALVALHVALVVVGLGLAATPLLPA